MRGVGGDGAQRARSVDALIGAQHLAAGGDAVHRVRGGAQRMRRRYRRVVVDGEAQVAPLRGRAWADPRRAIGAEEDALVPVAPEIDVIDEERGDHAQIAGVVELILADRLRMDDGRADVGGGKLMLCRADGGDQHVGSRVTVGMREQRPVFLVREAHPFAELLRRRGGIAAIVGGEALALAEIGLRQIPGPALERSVEHDLHAAEAEALRVIPRHRVHAVQAVGRQPVRHQIDRQRPARRETAQQRFGRRIGGVIGGGRHALGDEQRGGARECRVRLRNARRGQDAPDEDERRFLQHAVGVLPAGLAPDHAARWIGRFGADAGERQRFGVHRREVAGNVQNDDCAIGGDQIEIVPRRVALLGEQRVVIAHPHNRPRPRRRRAQRAK